MSNILPDRLKDAREYLGLSREQVAGKLEVTVARLAELESGGTTITGEELRKLSRLYRYPIPWFSGETRFEPDPALLRRVEELGPGDRAAVLQFAEWLSSAGPPPKVTRADLAGDDGGPDASS